MVTTASLWEALSSDHIAAPATTDCDFCSHSTTHERRHSVASRSRIAPWFCCATRLTWSLLFTCQKYRSFDVHYINLSVLCFSPQHSPITFKTSPPTITPSIAFRNHCTAAMSLPDTKTVEHHPSLEEMQLNKTAAQMKGGTSEDEREMSRMGKTQELRVCSAHIPNTPIGANCMLISRSETSSLSVLSASFRSCSEHGRTPCSPATSDFPMAAPRASSTP